MILTSTERILKETLNEVEQSLAENIIKQASFELTSSKVKFNCVVRRMWGAIVIVCIFQLVTESIFPL